MLYNDFAIAWRRLGFRISLKEVFPLSVFEISYLLQTQMILMLTILIYMQGRNDNEK